VKDERNNFETSAPEAKGDQPSGLEEMPASLRDKSYHSTEWRTTPHAPTGQDGDSSCMNCGLPWNHAVHGYTGV
jgi:hypothetical protein